ncbi:MAG: ATP-binding protein [Candidatus Pacebacteria bacterium]|nr:ATP-binding protein [Candidatus Paceibacterota bacterium]
MFFRKKQKEENFEQFYEKFFKYFQEEGQSLLSIIKFFTDGILFLDEKQKIVLVTPEAEKILQIKNNDIFGKSPLNLNEFPNIRPLIPFLAEKRQETLKKEIEIKENFFVLLSIIPIISKQEFLGTIVVLKDISQAKMLEKAKTDFVTLAAHQFRTPTSAIKWALSMILEENSNDLTKQQKALIQKTYNINNRMISLINNLLDFAKTEKGEQLLKPSLSKIDDFILNIIKSNQERIDKKQINLTFEPPQNSLPKVMIDPIKMKIAVENILDNAIRYTYERGEINIYFKKTEQEISVYFKDTGVGIPKSQQNKVFSYFFRGSNILPIHTEGIGLGLFLTKSIIEAHGGRIWFESVENKGSIFAFSLPIKEKFSEFLTKDFY